MVNNYPLDLNTWECIVPPGIRYLSDWKDFDFAGFPGKCIIDKQIPGCGYTEWAIRNNYNVILASPRKMLLENKSDQHPGEVFLVKNNLDRDPGVDRDLTKELKKDVLTKALSIETLGFDEPGLYDRLRNEFLEYSVRRTGQPLKILVTYDSYYIVKSILQDLGIFSTFFTVVDEYQSVLIDSRFKSSTEIEFMNVIKDVQYVHFVSATPMLTKYAQLLDDFKSLPIYKLNWDKEDPGRIVRPSLKVLAMKSVGEVLPSIIQKYLDGDFEKITAQREDGSLQEVTSTEAVVYLNSVNHIISIIKKMGLKPNQVNILCSKTPENSKKIKTRLGRMFEIGSVPLKDEPRKMFTFCTRTVYLGADFYSDNARSFIFSDANIECLAVDISQDLPQILGRQRLPDNPWKNSATFYYRSTAKYKEMEKEEFDKFLNQKIKSTNNLLTNYNSCIKSGDDTTDLVWKYRKDAKASAYKDDYVSVNVKTSSPVPVFNNYVYVSDLRAFDVQQVEYADRFSVFRELESKIVRDTSGYTSSLMKEYIDLNDNISKRIKFLCDLSDEFIQLFLDNLPNSDYAKSYYLQLGKARCKALGYNISRIRKELGIMKFDKDNLIAKILLAFKPGDRLTRASIKATLQSIYNRVNYQVTAKASDIENFFEVKVIKIDAGNGKRDAGFEIIKPLDLTPRTN